MKIFLKGFIIGIAKIIPGVSGSMLAISLGVYEKLLLIIANIRKINYNSFRLLFLISTGILLGICLFSYGIKWLLEVFYFPIMLLFIGMITKGIKECVNEVYTKNVKPKYFIVFILTFVISFILTNIGSEAISNEINLKIGRINTGILFYFILGIIEAFSSIIPGISGTAIYMSLGCYELLLDFYGNIFNPNYIKFTIAFSSGILIGIISISKIITYFLKKHKTIVYYAILGFMISSLFLMFIEAFSHNISAKDFIYGIIGLILGYLFIDKINMLFAIK